MFFKIIYNICKDNGFLKDHSFFIIIQGIIGISESPHYKAPDFNISLIRSSLIITLQIYILSCPNFKPW